MSPVKRVFVVVLDGVGVGELPDAAQYGDAGSSTLAHVAQAVGGLALPNLARLGLGRVVPVAGLPTDGGVEGAWGRLREASPGKDSVTGHWEMMGVLLDRPFPTYPQGFPPDVIEAFEGAVGRRVLGNVAASGTSIIEDLGEEHLRTGRPIVYTSADSVFQVAVHAGVASEDDLYAWCEAARRLLAGRHAVGRVIARPFDGVPGAFRRTAGRRDFPLPPPRNVLDELAEAGVSVHAIGKVNEFFAGRGIARWDHTTDNAAHAEALLCAARDGADPFVFANLEDFDMLYGHRNDPAGFAAALEAFDAVLGPLLDAMRHDDLLILTSDHGNDPTTASTDHSREHALLLVCGPGMRGRDLGTRSTFADIGATVRHGLGLPPGAHGRSFAPGL